MTDPTEAYALVTATLRGVPYVLLIETDSGWAMPGGAIEPDEWPAAAAARELEETGLRAPQWHPDYCSLDEPRRMPDPDGAVTVVARCDLGEVDALPEVRGGGDVRNARWWQITRGQFLTNIFPAHREILASI